MKSTPIKREVVDRLVDGLGIKDFAQATIREVKQVAAKAEKESGVEFIKMEMGIPGLPAAQVGVDAQIKAFVCPFAALCREHSPRSLPAYRLTRRKTRCCLSTLVSLCRRCSCR